MRAGTASSVTVHAVPRVHQTVGAPHAYGITFRARQPASVPESNPDRVRQARFTYVPCVTVRAPPAVVAWMRRLPVWTLPLSLVLLLLLLVFVGGWAWANTIMKPAIPPTRPRPTATPRSVSTTPSAVLVRAILLNPDVVRFG